MTFRPKSTADRGLNRHKTLLYAHHGFGKTFQCRNYQRAYGKGFIISGESGLKSIEDVEIDYLPFSSWDGEHDPEKDVYSFRGIMRMMNTDEFRAAGYQWIAIDSVTEMSERCLEHFIALHAGSKDNFAHWTDYERAMVGALKWVRDLPYHVLVTSLAAQEEDDNGAPSYWPMVKQKKIAKQLPGMFDHVFCGVRSTEEATVGGKTRITVTRHIITDEVNGWHGKARDPRQRLPPKVKCSDITTLHELMEMDDVEFARRKEAKRANTEEKASATTNDTE